MQYGVRRATNITMSLLFHGKKNFSLEEICDVSAASNLQGCSFEIQLILFELQNWKTNMLLSLLLDYEKVFQHT